MYKFLILLLFSVAVWGQGKDSKSMDPKTKVAIEELTESGNALLQNGEYKKAIVDFQKAYKLIPRPKKAWKDGVWILASMGDAYFFRKDYEAAIDNLVIAMEYPDGMGNPFLHLRLGQSYYETGDLKNAADEFALAYDIQGEDIFGYEDPKYFKFLKSKKKIK